MRLSSAAALLFAAACTTGASHEVSSVAAPAPAVQLQKCAPGDERLRRALREPHEGPTRSDLEAICGEVGGALREIAADTAGWGIERLRATEFLAHYPGDETMRTLTALATKDTLASVRRSAILSLGALGGPEALEVIEGASAGDQDPIVRKAAADAASRLRGK